MKEKRALTSPFPAGALKRPVLLHMAAEQQASLLSAHEQETKSKPQKR